MSVCQLYTLSYSITFPFLFFEFLHVFLARVFRYFFFELEELCGEKKNTLYFSKNVTFVDNKK